MAHEDYNMLGGQVGGGYLSATDPNQNGMYEDDSNYLYEQVQPQYVSNRSGVLAPAIAGAAAFYGAGQMDGRGYTPSDFGAEYLTPKVNSVPMDGPMRFAGRGIPEPSPDYFYSGPPEDNELRGPLMMSPGPSRRNDHHERFMQSGPAIRELYRKETESRNGGPRRGSVLIPDRPSRSEVDNRTDWQKWKDSFKEGFAAK